MNYCPFIFKTERFRTREVKVGTIGVGGNNPIRVQSMTTTDTRDVEATAEQIMKLADYGCDIARVTVQGVKEALACEQIKNSLIKKNYLIPVVADIHFFPKAALTVADFVDKIRINPGNFVDKRATFKTLSYTDPEYQQELDKLEEKLVPLINKCKMRKIPIRIGTNHGSLSDRVLNRYGDNPTGMVEAAFEFARVFRKYDFHDLVFSMKSSNTHVMIQAYRLLVNQMMQLGWDYPTHLGVTEAGSGEDGRLKSAIGIGALLLDGIGDTIRVSLTEDPWHEIQPCKDLVKLAEQYATQHTAVPFVEKTRSALSHQRKPTEFSNLHLSPQASVIISLSESQLLDPQLIQTLNLSEDKKVDSVDGIYLHEKVCPQRAESTLSELAKLPIEIFSDLQPELATASHLNIESEQQVNSASLTPNTTIFVQLKQDKLHSARRIIESIRQKQIHNPLILVSEYEALGHELVVAFGAELGSLFCDGLADGVMLEHHHLDAATKKRMSFSLLQGCRLRSSKTEFISCPSCGRTLFELQTVTRKIEARTAHLAGVKIAVMGCIVNGPGEMADADFGYVGSKPGKIDLYVGKECVEKDIDHKDAVERLVELIKKHNRWVEPQVLVEA